MFSQTNSGQASGLVDCAWAAHCPLPPCRIPLGPFPKDLLVSDLFLPLVITVVTVIIRGFCVITFTILIIGY